MQASQLDANMENLKHPSVSSIALLHPTQVKTLYLLKQKTLKSFLCVKTSSNTACGTLKFFIFASIVVVGGKSLLEIFFFSLKLKS